MKRDGDEVIFNTKDWNELRLNRTDIIKTASQSDMPGQTEITWFSFSQPNARESAWVPYNHEFVQRTLEKWDDEDEEAKWL